MFRICNQLSSLRQERFDAAAFIFSAFDDATASGPTGMSWEEIGEIMRSIQDLQSHLVATGQVQAMLIVEAKVFSQFAVVLRMR